MLVTYTGKQTVMESIELLTDNAKNLTYVVEEVLYATERAIIKLPVLEIERLHLLDQPISGSSHLGEQINFNAYWREIAYLI